VISPGFSLNRCGIAAGRLREACYRASRPIHNTRCPLEFREIFVGAKLERNSPHTVPADSATRGAGHPVRGTGGSHQRPCSPPRPGRAGVVGRSSGWPESWETRAAKTSRWPAVGIEGQSRGVERRTKRSGGSHDDPLPGRWQSGKQPRVGGAGRLYRAEEGQQDGPCSRRSFRNHPTKPDARGRIGRGGASFEHTVRTVTVEPRSDKNPVTDSRR